MSSDSTPCGVGRPEAGPLIDALRDDSPETRLAVLDALTRLPLEPDCWFEVREYVMWALEDPSAPEHLDVIGLATRVPIRSVRQRLVGIAESGEPEERQRAALALGRAGDDQAAGPLLALLDEEPEAAEVLALVDTSAIVDEIEQRWQRDGGLFLAVALAKKGRADALVAELERLSNDPGLAEEWLYTDETTELEHALSRAAPLPDDVRTAVDREWPGWFAGHLVSDILFALPPERVGSSSWKTSPADNLSAAERELVQDALGRGLPEHDVYQAEPVVKLADGLYHPLAAELERSHFDSLLVSELLVLAARGHRQSGDDAVLLAGALGKDYAPDVLGLLEAWRRTEKDDDVTRSQIAWAACRARLSELLAQLGAEIAGDPPTLAHFIGAAASWAESGDPPLTPAGDEPKAPEPGAPTELINDMLMAAPPPEMATANGPPMAEANGGAEPVATGRRRAPVDPRLGRRRRRARAAAPGRVSRWRRPRDLRRHRAEPGGRDRGGRGPPVRRGARARSPTWRS